MECPTYVKDLLAARHPDVSCLWSASHKRFLLVYRRDGRAALLRIMEDEQGNFLWPDIWNTVAWLTERDCAWANNYARRERLLSMLDEKKTKEEKILRAKMSDMVRMGLAPHFKHLFRKAAT